jgi:hypothetical protein
MVVLRSICKQRERARREVEVGGGGDGAYDEGRAIIEKPRFLEAAMEHVDGGVRRLRIDNGRRSGGGGVGDAAAAAVSAVVLEERRLAREASATLLLLCEK